MCVELFIVFTYPFDVCRACSDSLCFILDWQKCDLSFFFVSFARSFSTLLIFSKNQLFFLPFDLLYLKIFCFPFAATWMDLEMIILSEVSQTEKDKYDMISLICRILKKYK